MKATYIDHMGTDLSVVNAARVSFGKTSEMVAVHTHSGEEIPLSEFTYGNNEDAIVLSGYTKQLSKADQGLLGFLARGCTSGDWDNLHYRLTECMDYNENDGPHFDAVDEVEDLLNHIRKMPPHWTPFAHTAITLHLKMPIFVARQIMKHTAGFVYNEVSRRYVDDSPEFFVPDTMRLRADNVKQGSSNEEVTPPIGEHYGLNMFHEMAHYGTLCYEGLLSTGCSPEQARMVLPQSMYTEVIATANLYAWANLFIQRTDSHAQKETQDLAKQIGEIIEQLFPVSWKELVK
ncbi:FAD-dependent thymidylate synthase [Shimia sp.]|uniref:FAD-dependent thymidylate synthase n=1 Tax=Shimia sp. TaxID=1954381 RepID=UPI003BA96DAD